MSDLMTSMVQQRKAGKITGVPSYCTANDIVIEALIRQAKELDVDILIEATANQVNQFGGYTGMKPADFRDFVYEIADRAGYPHDRIVLGGDHLGPLTWVNEPEDSAMEKAVTLVKLFVEAGYKKIHLDTSMRVADDPTDQPLTDETVARRGAKLYQACEDSYQELLKKNPDEKRPVFIIGSEVPIPGGAQEQEDSISVTKPEAVAATLEEYRKQFKNISDPDAFDNVIGIVVQPGVEFGDDDVFPYDRKNAKELCGKIATFDGIYMEGHSTDYQPPRCLREMVEDGVAILKVGPALTFGLRDGLFALSEIEKILVPDEDQVKFPSLLERLMLEDTSKWAKYYHGTDKEIAIKRRYSLSDRCRYYFAMPEIREAIEKLIKNIDGQEMPTGLLYQYMPLQYKKVRDGELNRDARSLLMSFVTDVADDYNYAAGYIK
ncbi:MAG: class II D-tagatose-bisphosphate aldolase, non-catalytic subunit [Lachnospiraceae bacterium]|nr:class II D-tagatose-bisphosphate aldolase, non-catalytic subunit [Lachnospiraceae bacterium]